MLQVAREAPKVLHQIVCRKRDRLVLTPPEQICWFQVEDGVVKAHTAADTFTVNYQLGELEASLPADVFFRARREVLVNLTRIREIRPYFKSGFLLVMPDAAATEIVVSERQAGRCASEFRACERAPLSLAAGNSALMRNCFAPDAFHRVLPVACRTFDLRRET